MKKLIPLRNGWRQRYQQLSSVIMVAYVAAPVSVNRTSSNASDLFLFCVITRRVDGQSGETWAPPPFLQKTAHTQSSVLAQAGVSKQLTTWSVTGRYSFGFLFPWITVTTRMLGRGCLCYFVKSTVGSTRHASCVGLSLRTSPSSPFHGECGGGMLSDKQVLGT